MELETQCTLQSSRAGLAARQPWLAWLAPAVRWPLFPSSNETSYSCIQSAIDLKVIKFNAKLLVEVEVLLTGKTGIASVIGVSRCIYLCKQMVLL